MKRGIDFIKNREKQRKESIKELKILRDKSKKEVLNKEEINKLKELINKVYA